MNIVRDSNLCYTGCKTCQLVSSFHYAKVFWPDQSSISVSRNFKMRSLNDVLKQPALA